MTTALLVSALQNLAASAEKQAAYLENLGVSPSCDELALDLQDALGEQGLSPTFDAAVTEVNAQLDKMSGQEKAALWHVDALTSAEDWELVRCLAAKALHVGGYMEDGEG